MVLEEIARAPRAERLLVGDRRVAQAAVQPVAHRMQVEVGQGQGGKAALHVAGAASVNASVDDVAAIRAPVPFAVGGGESVNMPIEHEVAAGPGAVETRDDIGHVGVWRDDRRIEAGLAQGIEDEIGRLARVARRVG